MVKHPDVRRDELLDVALDHIRRTGFAAMSVEQITSAAGVAKGTFYYYFASKDDLLTQLVERFGESMFQHLATTPTAGTGLQRLQAFLAIASSWKLERIGTTTTVVTPFLFSQHNLAVRHHLFAEWNERTRELLEPIIEAGRLDGSFSIEDAAGTTGVVLSLWLDGGLRIWDRALAAPDEPTFVDELHRGSLALSAALERILGAPAGSLTPTIDPAMLVGLRDPFLADSQRTSSAERRTS